MSVHKIFDSVADWKAEYLYLYSDIHKDAYGSRPHGSDAWMYDEDTPMEDVMAAMHSICETATRECEREYKDRILWDTKKWIHAHMLLEAKCEENGIVFPNPDWDDWCEEDKHYADYSRVINAEDFYFNRNGNISNFGDII